MAEIIQDPQLRYTPDNQIALTEMLVQFPGLRDVDPPATLKVIAWGNFAQEVHEKYHQGDQIIIEGRLGMNTIERQEGFKEKRAELTAQRIYPAQMDLSRPTQTFDPATPTQTKWFPWAHVAPALLPRLPTNPKNPVVPRLIPPPLEQLPPMNPITPITIRFRLCDLSHSKQLRWD